MENTTQYFRLLLFLLFGCLISPASYSQTKYRISLTSGISSNALFTSANLVGGGSHEGKGASAFGIRYTRNLNKSFSFDTGLEYSSNKIESSATYHPGFEKTFTESTVRMVSVPLYGNYTFLKYLFVNAGALIDLETEISQTENRSIDSQSGIGFGLGAGGQYHFKKMTVLVNPFFQKHAVIPFAMNKQPERLGEIGLKLGLGYNF